ncbi:MAG: hypothetical protein CL946_00340 [Ectothiorhodospiraceae bacterium]|nr:hypothetical protein [Ectothiorhodospiraceae bacterium]
MNNRPTENASIEEQERDSLALSPLAESAVSLNESERAIDKYLSAALSGNTRRTYTSMLRSYVARGGRLPSSPDHLCHVLATTAEALSPDSQTVLMSAISKWHSLAGFQDPTNDERVKLLLKGVRNTHGRAKRKAHPITPNELNMMLVLANQASCQRRALRDRALLLLSYFGNLRPNDVVTRSRRDVVIESRGMKLLIPESKTDQAHAGQCVYIPRNDDSEQWCPVAALDAWIALPPEVGSPPWRDEDPLFLQITRWGRLVWDEGRVQGISEKAFNEFAQGYARKLGIRNVSGHSFRRGFTTAGIEAGSKFSHVKRQGRWVSDSSVSEYIEPATGYTRNACVALYIAMVRSENDGLPQG